MTLSDIIYIEEVIILKLEYCAKINDDKKDLKYILKKRLYISNVELIKLKNTKSIKVNDKIEHVDKTINCNDKITVDFDNMINNYKALSFTDKFSIFKYDFNILYEDEYLLILNKPYNMIIHPVSNDYEHTLSNAVMYYLISKDQKYSKENIHIVTRLDKDTSGICIFAKNAYTQQLFISKKNQVNLNKEYIAIVNGIIKEDHQIIEKNIKRKADSIINRCVSDDGDYAKTEYFVIERNYAKNYTIVKVKIYTGRTHQIRVHMSYIKHVLLGDDLYADESNLNDINKYIQRQALHCYHVSFFHPITEKYIDIFANIPDDMNKLIAKKEEIRKYF